MDNEFNNKLIGSHITSIRMKQGMRQIELARAVEISQTHMSNIENGNAGLSLHTACKISQCLGCSIDELVYGEKQTKPINSFKNFSLEDLVEVLNILCKK